MNKIYQLFDQQFVNDLFTKEILPLYPDFKTIKTIKILPIKENIWQSTYHVVIEFQTTFLKTDKKTKKLSVFCSAHSSEPRKNSYEALTFLWQHHFGHSRLTIPRPLFFSDSFNAVFYRGAQGKNLYYYIKQNNFTEIELIIPRVAAWFVKLHQLPTAQAKNFNEVNSRIETVIPGIATILSRIKTDYAQFYQAYFQIYRLINEQEKQFFKKSKNIWLIHGDAHPENVIKISKSKLAIIDFTDICLADFARDLGSFLQQLEFMTEPKIADPTYIEKIKNLFLINYLTKAKIKLDEGLSERIKYYYNWTALRTASFFLLKDNPEPGHAKGLINQICQNLKIDITV